ncbi:MAG: peroxiredoxin family protein [Gammaproteobacteria bacterium]|nr:peroxiredoxin family protein [Gammaproteobacteria bacterium]MCW8922545.1 peroxiredoxin family protein [Gammaproteobacteria bacterium]
MSCVKTLWQLLILTLLLVGLSACDIKDDLLPSDDDERGTVESGSIGNMPGQIAADFTLKNIFNNDFVLSDHLAGGSDPADVVVLYFTMWCPICTSHTDHIYTNIIPQFSSRGTVVYALIDYVSGSVSATYNIAQANGYLTPKFDILADVDQAIYNQFNGAMGITIVIDSDGTILMNEDFRSGETLVEILDQQLPL